VSVLLDYVESLFTQSAPGARSLGYVRESFALRARRRRQARAWAAHQAETVRFLEALPADGEALVILGSGPLLDVPLEALAARWPRVVLVDLVHPRAALARAKTLRNVTVRLLDVTGCVAALDAGAARANPRPPSLDLPTSASVVSLNLLSQLPILPLERLARMGTPAPEAEAFAQALVHAHLEWLTSMRVRRSALVTDVRRRWAVTPRDGGDTVCEVEDTLHGQRLPPPDRAWTWAVAPRGELDAETELTLDVEAFFDLRTAG
jgi:hypothetical protein